MNKNHVFHALSQHMSIHILVIILLPIFKVKQIIKVIVENSRVISCHTEIQNGNQAVRSMKSDYNMVLVYLDDPASEINVCPCDDWRVITHQHAITLIRWNVTILFIIHMRLAAMLVQYYYHYLLCTLHPETTDKHNTNQIVVYFI